MDVYNTEEEQLKAIKEWWSENGTSIIVGIIIGIGGFLGYNWWKDSQTELKQGASVAYELFTDIDFKANKDEFVSAGEAIKQEYADTAYGALAALHLAKQFIQADDLASAQTQLEWAVKNTEGTEMQPLVSTRLARVLLEQGKVDAALATVNAIKVASFEGMKQRLLGDIYAKQGNKVAAQEAYTKAKEASESFAVKNELDMMIDDLAVATETTTTSEPTP
ncbi:MAG: tetratricopeptide repeat protein [Gammaproteobacteria bacterium]|nr:tetratricopeptide repeat protein [Gammaproteobacteria bacterium]